MLLWVVPATAGPLGERPPALVGHFCNVPITVFAVLISLYPAATRGHFRSEPEVTARGRYCMWHPQFASFGQWLHWALFFPICLFVILPFDKQSLYTVYTKA